MVKLFQAGFLGLAIVAMFMPLPSYAQRASSVAIEPAPNFAGVKLYNPEDIEAFYTARNGNLLWLSGGIGRGQEALKFLELSWKQGLNPQNYHIDIIRQALKEDLGADAKARVDRIISDAVAHYGQDMTGLRVRASVIGLRDRDWRKKLTVSEVLTLFVKSSNIGSAFNLLVPKSELYEKLSRELVNLSDNMQQGKGNWVVNPIKVEGKIYPGERDPAIPLIRERLGQETPKGLDPTVYDDKLAKAVMDYQIDHGTRGDAIIGPKTAYALNQSLKDRFIQAIANMERIRWLEPTKPARYIVVNIPAQTLWAVDNNKVEIEMPVAVGRKARQTNSFKAIVTGIRFNPTWTVPPTIKKQDFLPELRKNGALLDEHSDVKIYRDGALIDPATIDWENVTEEEIQKFDMVQEAGNGNALGQIRVLMPNDYNIYLHDTNTPSVFDRGDRAVSSGCVRLSDPKRIAHFVLEHNENWSDEVLEKRIATGKTSEIAVAQTFPIYLLYQTTWLKGDGSVVFANDLYDEDIKLFNALEKKGEVPIFTQKRHE